MPIAEGAVSWNGFLKQVGFNPPTVYEVSGNGIILEGEQFATPCASVGVAIAKVAKTAAMIPNFRNMTSSFVAQ